MPDQSEIYDYSIQFLTLLLELHDDRSQGHFAGIDSNALMVIAQLR